MQLWLEQKLKIYQNNESFQSKIENIIFPHFIYLLRVRISWNAVIASEAKQSFNYLGIMRLHAKAHLRLCHFVPRNDR